MAKSSIPINHFKLGEWDDNMSARSDVEGFNNSLRESFNGTPTTQGIDVKRGGTLYIDGTNSNLPHQLIPFGNTHFLEVAASGIRIRRRDGTLLESGGSPIVLSSPFSFTQDVQWAQKEDLLVLVSSGIPPQVFTMGEFEESPTIASLELDWGPLQTENIDLTEEFSSSAVSGLVTITRTTDTAGTPTVVDTELNAGQLIGFRCIPQALHDQWVTGTAYLVGDYVWSQSYESSRVNVYKAATAGTAGSRAPGHDLGTESDGTVDWQMVHSEWGFAEVTGTTATTATANVVGFPELPQDALTTVGSVYGTFRWAAGVFGAKQTVGAGPGIQINYPSAVAFHQQRLVFGGGAFNNQSIYGSAIDNFTFFHPGLTDDNAPYNFLLDSDIPVAINSLSSLRDLFVGTSGGIHKASGTAGGPITPTNINVSPSSKTPIESGQKMAVGNQSVFVKSQEKVYRTEFIDDRDNIDAVNESFVNSDFLGIERMFYSSNPDQTIWMLYNDPSATTNPSSTRDKQLLSLSFDEKYGLHAWSQHKIGGESIYNIKVESLCVVPGDPDQVWLCVNRNGTYTIELLTYPDQTFIEFIGNQGGPSNVIVNGIYMDGTVYQHTSTTTVTGLNHLEGETVTAVKNDDTWGGENVDIIGTFTVSGGQITLDSAESEFFVGVPYKFIMQTQRITGGSVNGSSDGKLKRIHNVILRVVKTGDELKVGTNESNLTQITFRDTNMLMNNGIPLYTGDKKAVIKGGNDQAGSIRLEHELPVSCRIAGMFVQIHVEDDA